MGTSSTAIYKMLRPHWAFLHDFYQGGWRITMPSSPLADQSLTVYVATKDGKPVEPALTPAGNRRSYLVPNPGETPEEFDLRVKLAVNINFCATIVDAYADAITPGITRDLGALGPYLENVDGQGMKWAGLVDDVARWTSCYGFFATVLDAPAVNPATTALEESQLGISLRVISVHPTAIAWVKIGDDGALEEFAYREADYDNAGAIECNARVWLWTRTEWALIEGKVDQRAPLEGQRDKLKGVSGKSGKHGTPGRVPVAFCYFKRDTSMNVPLGMSLIDDAAKGQQLVLNGMSRIEHYQRVTAPFLGIPQQEAKGVLHPQTAVTVGPDVAFGYPSNSGAPAWVTPPTEMPADIRTHIVFVIAAMLRTSGLEVSADASAQVQSGEALRVRSRGFESTARRFAMALESWENTMLDLAALWLHIVATRTVQYPERYVLPDMAEDLARAIAFAGTFGADLGAEGTIALLRQALNAACTLSEDDANRILTEAYAKLRAQPQPKGAAA